MGISFPLRHPVAGHGRKGQGRPHSSTRRATRRGRGHRREVYNACGHAGTLGRYTMKRLAIATAGIALVVAIALGCEEEVAGSTGMT